MNSLFIRDFRFGLDTRKSELTQRPGSLEELHNAFVNQGGEIENRKAFVRTARVAGTFGLQGTSAGLVTFGSGDLAASHPVNISTVEIPIFVDYQRLQHPAVLAGETEVSDFQMTSVVHSFVYRGKAFVIAAFGDGRNYCYYDGTLVSDFTAGLILPYLEQNNVKIASNIVNLINTAAGFDAEQVTFASTQRARIGGVATITVASTAGLVLGQQIQITGFSGGASVYNKSLATLIAPLTSTVITYAIADLTTEGTTADTSGVITSSLLTVTGETSREFGVLPNAASAAGTFTTPTVLTTAIAGVNGTSAIGSFRLSGGRAGGAASSTLTSTGVNVTAGDTVTINGKVYTFVVLLGSTEGQVLVGGSAADSLTNLVAAINHGNTSAVNYFCAERNPDVEAGDVSGSAFTVLARIGGTAGNSITVSDSAATLSWSNTPLSGGTASSGENTIESIQVISPTGTVVNALQFPVDFVVDVATTNDALVEAINDYSDTSGYSATLVNGVIYLHSEITASPQPNNYVLQITAKGNVCVGECFFYITIPQNSLNLTALSVDGVNVLGGTISAVPFPGSYSPGTLTKIYSVIESQINAQTSAGIAHGILACSYAGFMQISRKVTRSDQTDIPVYLTFAGTSPAGGGVVFVGDPLTPTIPDSTFVATVSPISYSRVARVPNLSIDDTLIYEGVYPVTCTASGGSPPYTYKWIAIQGLAPDFYQIPGEQIVHQIVSADQRLITSIAARQYTEAITNIDGVAGVTAVHIDRITNGKTYSCQFVCRVTDSEGKTTLSNFFTFILTTLK